MIGLIVSRTYDLSIGIGFEIYGHRHLAEELPVHIHLLFTLGPWFVEIRFGKEER